MSNDYTTLENVIVVAMTGKAALLEVCGLQHWVPLANIFEDDVDEMGIGLVMDEINVKTWFYEKELA